MHNFVKFHPIESKIEQSQEVWEKRYSSVPYWSMRTQIASLLLLMIHILHMNFCAISSTRWLIGWLVGWVKRRTRASQWAIADGLGLIPKDGPETCHHNFYLSRMGMAPPLWYTQRYNLGGNLEDIAPMTDFTCTKCHYRTWRCFARRATNPGPPIWSWVLIQLAHRGAFIH